MRNPKRIDEILKRLGDSWKKHPDLRLGQLIYNALFDTLIPFYYVEDDVLINLIQNCESK